ncbi:MAG: methyltransferase domain-containing protein [Alphaproteobacteria bacterium]|nr:methyltransferase domain-containing protein [Alphaproteobacteria bacterium]
MSSATDIHIFDRKAAALKRARIKKDHLFLFDWAQKQIAERLDVVNRDFDLALQLGTRGDQAPLLSSPKIKTLLSLDTNADSTPGTIADEEMLPLETSSLDLVTSALNLHSINDLPGTLIQIRRALKADGLFVGALLGGETLHELRDSLAQAELKLKDGMSPRVFPFADKQQMGALMQRAGFALPVIDSEIITVTYENIFKLMHDLRFMGESNIIAERSRTNPGKDFFMEAARHYAQNYSEPDGRIRASFEVIFLLGWAPHESQQKPLAPGSAQKKLADALRTDEIKTGEKATP